MIHLQITDPADSKLSFGHGEDLSNYAVIADPNLFTQIRDSFVLDVHLRREIQNRPFYTYNGSAEHLFLFPLLRGLFNKGTRPPVANMIHIAQEMSALSMGISALNTSVGIKGLSAYLASYLPSPGSDVYSSEMVPPGGGGKPENANGLFTVYLHDLFTNPDIRESILRMKARGVEPKLSITPPVPGIPVDDLADLIKDINIFGVAGKQHPLMGKFSNATMAAQFAVEQYLFDTDGGVTGSENRFATAIMYLMYSEIVKTPESYDAIMPTVHLTPNDSIVASNTLKLIGQVAKTNMAAAYSSTCYNTLIYTKQIKELIEYMSTIPNHDPSSLGRVNEYLNRIDDIITEVAYAPVRTLANETFDYVKQWTGARYILPSWIKEWKSYINEKPFAYAPYPQALTVPSGFRGTIPGVKRINTFGINDASFLYLQLEQKLSDALGALTQMKHKHDTILTGLMVPSGDVIVHLDNLGRVFQDPPIYKLEPPTPTRVYVTPSYFSWFNKDQAGSPTWFFSDKLVKPLFLNAYRRSGLQTNKNADHFAWDTEVRLTASPSTGTDFAALLVPSHYVADCSTQVLANSIAVVKQELNQSPYRPLANITDFFTPIFQTIAGGASIEAVIANALASMFFIYKKKPFTTPSSFSDPNGWVLIKPQLPFIYGHPVDQLIAANEPFKNSANPATINHIEMSMDGEYMCVLHRFLPKAMSLRYIPFIMEGGTTISLPIAAHIVKAAREEALVDVTKATDATPSTYYSSFMKHLNNKAAGVTNGLFEVTHWLPSFAYFPHIFVTNRNASAVRAQTTLIQLLQMEQRFVFGKDAARPNGTQINYFRLNPVMFEAKDEIEAFSSAVNVIDLKAEIGKASSGGGVTSSGTDKKSTPPKLNPDPPLVPEPHSGPANPESSDPKTGLISVDPVGDPIPNNNIIPVANPDKPEQTIGT